MAFSNILILSVVLAITQGALSIGTPRRPTGNRIVGGEDAEIEQYPYQLSLIYNTKHWCGAVLISDRFAVTAALCANGAVPQLLSLRAGTSTINKGGVVRQVKRILEHPQYDEYYYDYDLTILEVEEPFPLGPTIQPVGLPAMNQQFPDGTDAMVTGFGSILEGSNFLGYQLQAAKVNMVSNSDCAIAFRGITDRMVCAEAFEGGKGPCAGDIGTPLVSNGKLVGVSSWGYGCGIVGYPGVYASISSMRDFISNVAGI